MSRGWDTFVYRTDVDPQEYVGFFFDDKEANAWIKYWTKQHGGTYEASDEPPKRRTSAEEADNGEEHAGSPGDPERELDPAAPEPGGNA